MKRAGDPPAPARAARIAVFLLAGGVAAHAAELRMLVSPGFGPVMQDLGPKFERATGNKLTVSADTLGAIVRRVRDGETFDVVLSPRSAVDGFVREGRAPAGSMTVVASAGMGVAVRKGAAKPDVSSPDALKRALLTARSLTYPDPKNAAGNAALGLHMIRVLERLGIAEQMKSKTVSPGARDVGSLVASGEAEIGIAQIQNLGRAEGIEIIGPLPADLQDPVVFAAVIMAGTGDLQASKALIDFLFLPESAAAISAHRMEPARRRP